MIAGNPAGRRSWVLSEEGGRTRRESRKLSTTSQKRSEAAKAYAHWQSDYPLSWEKLLQFVESVDFKEQDDRVKAPARFAAT